MRVLVPIAYYTPEIAGGLYLESDLLEDMAKYGWHVDIYTPSPSRGIDRQTRKLYKNRKLEVRHNGNLLIHRFILPGEHRNSILRAFRYLLLNLIFLLKGISTEADIVLVGSTPPTQGAMGSILKKMKKIPMLYILQDVFPDSLVNCGMIKKGSIIWSIGRKIEDFTYKNADTIITISEDFKKNIVSKGVPPEKIEVVHNWVDEKAVGDIDRTRNALFDRFNLDRSKFYITHCGNIGYTQNIDLLLEVAVDLEFNKDIAFILIGDGAYKADVEKAITTKNIFNVQILPFQPYEKISEVFSLGDVGLVISKPHIGQNSIPCKTWSIMAARRPVLASFDLDGDLCTMIRKSASGFCVQAGDKEKLKEAILYLYNHRDKAIELGSNGRNYIAENLSRRTGTAKYIDIISRYEIQQNRMR